MRSNPTVPTGAGPEALRHAAFILAATLARYYLKGGLYGGLNGWFQGDDKGKLYMEHGHWDRTDPEVRRTARTLNDQVIEVMVDGEVGSGIMEYGVGKGYAKYAEVQAHPPI